MWLNFRNLCKVLVLGWWVKLVNAWSQRRAKVRPLLNLMSVNNQRKTICNRLYVGTYFHKIKYLPDLPREFFRVLFATRWILYANIGSYGDSKSKNTWLQSNTPVSVKLKALSFKSRFQITKKTLSLLPARINMFIKWSNGSCEEGRYFLGEVFKHLGTDIRCVEKKFAIDEWRTKVASGTNWLYSKPFEIVRAFFDSTFIAGAFTDKVNGFIFKHDRVLSVP